MLLEQEKQRTAELEAALIEYVESYGLTDKARRALSIDPHGSKANNGFTSFVSRWIMAALIGLRTLLTGSQNRE